MRRSHTLSLLPRAALLALLSALALAPPPASAQAKTYVAVGDSLAYGFMDPAATPLGTAGARGTPSPTTPS